jgi:magnesium transporter
VDKKRIFSQETKIGMAPGHLSFTGEKKMSNVQIEVTRYDEKSIEVKSFTDITMALSYLEKSKKACWMNIEGLHDVAVIESIMRQYDLHRLTGEDILNVNQRAKLDDYNNYIHVSLRMFMLEQDEIINEQVTLILTKNSLITFQEKKGDVFNFVRKRLFEGKGQIRSRGVDYLNYALIDSIVDHYFVVLEDFGNKLDDLEIELLQNPTDHVLKKLYHLRREALILRRSIYPLREVVSQLQKHDGLFITDETKVFIRDLYDHVIQVFETIEAFRDSTSGLLDLYMNSVSNKMNGIMKVLTIVSTLFIPLTFIAGLYGMNFKFMPELDYKYGYFIVLLIMIVLAILMVVYFKRKKWL